MGRPDFNEVQRHSVRPKRPLYLTGAAVALVVIGVWYLVIFSLFLVLPMFYHYVRSSPLVPVLISVGFLVSLAFVASGVGVIRGASWSRPLAIVGLSILIVKAVFPVIFTHAKPSLLGERWALIAFYVCIFLLLLTPGASAFFRRTASKR